MERMGNRKLICLGVESSAHTIGVGIVDSVGNILADERAVYRPERGAGIIPSDAAEHHYENAAGVVQKALDAAGLSIKDVDVFSFTRGPGLHPCLRIGAAASRYLSSVLDKPLVGVNHCVAHIEIGRLTTGVDNPVVLYLSGGNTQVISYAEGFYRVFGETEDIPIGNAMDGLARVLKLEMPGGPEIERLALGGKYIEMPYVVKGMDLSFSGMLTESINMLREGNSKEDVCYSIQETSFSMLAEVAERALAHTGKKDVLLVGGVAANKRLQEMLRAMCDERGGRLSVVDGRYAGDNGVMIAWTGLLEYKSKSDKSKPSKSKSEYEPGESGADFSAKNSAINQNWRSDETKISWVRS
jgi:universal protein Kae1